MESSEIGVEQKKPQPFRIAVLFLNLIWNYFLPRDNLLERVSNMIGVAMKSEE